MECRKHLRNNKYGITTLPVPNRATLGGPCPRHTRVRATSLPWCASLANFKRQVYKLLSHCCDKRAMTKATYRAKGFIWVFDSRGIKSPSMQKSGRLCRVEAESSHHEPQTENVNQEWCQVLKLPIPLLVAFSL